MLTYLAKRLSSFFLYTGIIKEQDKRLYDYSFEILLSTLLNFCSIMMVAIITDTLLSTMCFIVGFMVVRATAGGYHADTHIACFMILMVSYGTYVVMLKNLSNLMLDILTIVFSVMATILVFLLSPIEDRNKPLTDKEIKKLKKKSRVVIGILMCLSVGLAVYIENAVWGFSLATGMFKVATSLVAGKFKNERRKKLC